MEGIPNNSEKELTFKSWLESSEGLGIPMGNTEELVEFLLSLSSDDRGELYKKANISPKETEYWELALTAEVKRREMKKAIDYLAP